MRSAIITLFLVSCFAVSQNMVSGRVTYLASGSVYLSIGRVQGLVDSSRVVVLRSSDTIAVLQVFAVSSKSSVCKIVERRRPILLGDSITAIGYKPSVVTTTARQAFDSTALSAFDTSRIQPPSFLPVSAKNQESIRGRIGIQYNSMLFDDASLNMQQPGLLLNMRGGIPGLPIKFDLYGTFRMSGRNNTAPFSSEATNDSRFYRFALEYDDRNTIYTAGRILPMYASSVGYIDGISVSRNFGTWIGGVAVGFQPDAYLQWPGTETKKIVLFSQYQPYDSWNTNAGCSYARIWSSAGIEREALSASLSMYTPSGFSLYASSDIDLRTLSQQENVLSPALSLLICSANYRLSDVLTLGVGIDASRPVYSLSSNRTIPDSLLDKELHSGFSFNLNLSIMRGTGLYNSYTYRPAGTAFNAEYSNITTMYYNNILMTGSNLRVNYMVNNNFLTTTHGFGTAIQKNLWGVDLGIRYQQNQSDIQQLQTSTTTTTVGVDISAFLTNQLTLMGSYDQMNSSGLSSRSLFLELSRRL